MNSISNYTDIAIKECEMFVFLEAVYMYKRYIRLNFRLQDTLQLYLKLLCITIPLLFHTAIYYEEQKYWYFSAMVQPY